jgi:hypothetical protein
MYSVAAWAMAVMGCQVPSSCCSVQSLSSLASTNRLVARLTPHLIYASDATVDATARFFQCDS